ncbi:MAG: HAD family phosphatase [Dehalococcoidia bacterium]
MTPPIHLVVFDLGGVIVRAARSFEEACVLAGCGESPLVTDEAFLGRHAQAIAEYMAGRISTDAYVEACEQASDGRLTRAEARRILDAWVEPEYPGVAAVLDAIEAAGVRTAVLSNTNAAHWALIAEGDAREAYPSVHRHAHIFASHLVGLTKPDPALFAAVEDATGVDAAHILYFDDVLPNIEAARARGWQAEHINHLVESTAPQLLAHLRRHGVIA